MAPFLVLLVALLVRPWGLLGTPEQIDRVRRILLALALAVFPFVPGPVALNLANQVALAALGALALTVLLGTAD